MGSSEFEGGDQPDSLRRIFATAIVIGSTTVMVGTEEVRVYMVAKEGFPFQDYQQYLQQLAKNNLQLKERTHFDDVIKSRLGIKIWGPTPSTNAWFDFENDVLWTLSEDDQKSLLEVLKNIKDEWANK